eukprot:COSAG02_NODE_928_length_15853_cov_9.053574_15_plen_106_part_00
MAIDLGRPAEIARVELDFETAFAKEYKIELSGSAADGSGDWTTVFLTQNGSGKPTAKRHVVHNADLLGGRPPPAPIGRWVRVTLMKLGTAWGVSLWEVRVYGRFV